MAGFPLFLIEGNASNHSLFSKSSNDPQNFQVSEVFETFFFGRAFEESKLSGMVSSDQELVCPATPFQNPNSRNFSINTRFSPSEMGPVPWKISKKTTDVPRFHGPRASLEHSRQFNSDPVWNNMCQGDFGKMAGSGWPGPCKQRRLHHGI